MAKRFKGLDLIARGPEELWMEVCDIVQEVLIKTIPKKKKFKKVNGCLRRHCRVPLSTLQYLGRCRMSTAAAPQGSVSTQADGKCLRCSVVGNALGKCQFVVDTWKLIPFSVGSSQRHNQAKGGRRKDLLLATNKENKGNLPQSCVSQNNKIGEVLS